MFYEKNKNTRYYNWLIHHYCILTVKEHACAMKGKVLDVGCGSKPYKQIIEANCDTYIGLEHSCTLHGLSEVDIVANALTLPFGNECFDWLVSFQVMEHVAEPQLFLSEVFRVLKKGGNALLTTPFMWGEHEQPCDYFRYTRYGLEYLAKKAGFEVISIKPDTGYWTTAILRFNYWLLRFSKGPLKYVFMPILWADQFIGLVMDKADNSYTVDTATFSAILRKPR